MNCDEETSSFKVSNILLILLQYLAVTDSVANDMSSNCRSAGISTSWTWPATEYMYLCRLSNRLWFLCSGWPHQSTICLPTVSSPQFCKQSLWTRLASSYLFHPKWIECTSRYYNNYNFYFPLILHYGIHYFKNCGYEEHFLCMIKGVNSQ